MTSIMLLGIWTAFFAVAESSEHISTGTPTVGAIRWDGWFADNPWQKNLNPAEWHDRLPFYGTTLPDGTVRVCADSQETMDKEIVHAKAGGLRYWAFCYYHPKSWKEADSYNYGWKRYLASPKKGLINFCLLLQGGSHLGPPGDWPQTVAQFVGMFKEPTYQKVCDGRPLVYFFGCENIISNFGSAEAARAAFDLLRGESVKAGAGKPYLVAQIWPHQVEAPFIKELGFDALSAYSAPGSGEGEQPYAKLVESNRYYWDTFCKSGKDVIPLVNAGWDGRPRQYTGSWYPQGTPDEIAGNIRSAFDWICGNRAAAPANTVLVYAWNEHDEGGWLCPTLKEGPTRLDAIRKMLDAYKRP